MRFDKSLRELREIRSQLHKAAEYCETTFSKSKEKSDVLKNTKEYISRTMVTVVDHLGNVSANLDALISHANAFSQADLRIQCLQQRLERCEEYARKLALAQVQWNDKSLRFHSRYLSATVAVAPPLERSSSKKVVRDGESKIQDKHVSETHEDLPLFIYNHTSPFQNLKPTKNTTTLNNPVNLAMVAPVKDGLSFLTKVPNPTFHFQNTQKIVRHKRSLRSSHISWLLRRSNSK
ncbi:hypothetical protein VNO78_10128 [Psophocarpus tetragonolobus]|uniref:Protein ABIL5 n=1 Tax=Psophocarpus tetragonolobus TaxID=3891 RepID=A0AAN9SJB2_PSOTE